ISSEARMVSIPRLFLERRRIRKRDPRGVLREIGGWFVYACIVTECSTRELQCPVCATGKSLKH
ncbi:MAG TPA: hypothetical protein VFV92_15365, partial [Candidatus Bathyarchaeia archaeon]|nr:hypothetical protein [Candidatus Bathyarchaeia archaeon]